MEQYDHVLFGTDTKILIVRSNGRNNEGQIIKIYRAENVSKLLNLVNFH